MVNAIYYTEKWTEEKKQFIIDNIQYLKLDANKRQFDAYDIVCWNKLQVEKGIYLDTEGSYDNIYVSLPEHRHYWKIGEAGKSSYEDYEKNLKAELEKRNLCLADLQLLQRYSSIAWYSRVENWKIEKNKKLIIEVKDGYSTETILDFLLYLEDGNIRENLADANALYDSVKQRFRSVSGYIDYGNFTCRSFYNGKVEISMKNKADFSEAFLNRFYNFHDVYTRAHKNVIWCTWVNG